jgi:alcohol dehydrogenase YqhD (iron-dependent ADH family)
MLDFTYYAPTKVIFGRDADKDVGSVLKENGPKKILVHYGQGSVKKSGLLDKITSSLTRAGLSYIEIGGVEPNPKVSFVRNAIDNSEGRRYRFPSLPSAARQRYRLGIKHRLPCRTAVIRGTFQGSIKPTKAIPLATVLTISAAGSEMSNANVLTNADIRFKKGITNDLCRPVVSFMNPENTFHRLSVSDGVRHRGYNDAHGWSGILRTISPRR